MTLHNFNDGAQFVASSSEILRQLGITLETGTDFDLYRTYLKEARPDHILGVPLDPRLQNMDASNSYWLIGRDSAGAIMHTQAMRVLDLQGASLGTYLLNRFREFPPSGVDLDLARSRYRAGPGAKRMRGKVCYHGEFWIGGDKNRYRGKGLACVLGRAGYHEALERWNPDYVFGFMAKDVAFKGFAERHGYMHNEPGAVRWCIRDVEKPVEGFMVYMEREDMRYILEMPLTDLVAMAA